MNNIYRLQKGENFESIYELQDVLGEGCVGLVKRAIKKSTKEEFAVKIVRTRDDETIMNIKNEFLHLRQLSHPNIVKVYEIYIDLRKGKIYTVMELIKAKEMFEVIHELGSYSEEVAKKIFRQIVEAIAYMHNHYVCHRDLKPNNILCDESGENVKITDFNVSKFCDSYKNYSTKDIPHQRIKMWTYTGTIAFSAPEIFKEECYDESIDVWSAGVILYTMLSGKEPFHAEFVSDLIQIIIKGEYSFPADPWDSISFFAKDLIQQCLTVNPQQRIKPEFMLQHPWLAEFRKSSKSELDRNHLASNFDRLVKGRSNSFEQTTRMRRSNTISMNPSDYLFSMKCFENPSSVIEEDDCETLSVNVSKYQKNSKNNDIISKSDTPFNEINVLSNSNNIVGIQYHNQQQIQNQQQFDDLSNLSQSATSTASNNQNKSLLLKQQQIDDEIDDSNSQIIRNRSVILIDDENDESNSYRIRDRSVIQL